jgi:hypothetical protein
MTTMTSRMRPSASQAAAKAYKAARGEEKVNRNNSKFKIRHNLLQTNDIPKVNRNKNSIWCSPYFRLPAAIAASNFLKIRHQEMKDAS